METSVMGYIKLYRFRVILGRLIFGTPHFYIYTWRDERRAQVWNSYIDRE